MAFAKTTVWFNGLEVADNEVAGRIGPGTRQASSPAGEEVGDEAIPGVPHASSPPLGSVVIGQELELVAHSVAFRALAAVCEQVAADLDAKFASDKPTEG
jgi:hypothetical protein